MKVYKKLRSVLSRFLKLLKSDKNSFSNLISTLSSNKSLIQKWHSASEWLISCSSWWWDSNEETDKKKIPVRIIKYFLWNGLINLFMAITF